jgi:hypothetical protein
MAFTRTRATVLLLNGLRDAFWSWRHICRDRYQQTERRCVKRKHRDGPHTDGILSWGDDKPEATRITGGHVWGVPESGRRR